MRPTQAFLLLALLLASCAGSKRQAAVERIVAEAARANQHHVARHQEPYADSAAPAARPRPDLTPRQERKLIAARSKAAARVAKAQPPTVPKKVSVAKGGIYAPSAAKVNGTYKPAAVVAQGDSTKAADNSRNRGALQNDSPAATNSNEQPKRRPWWLWLVGLFLAALVARRLATGKWLL